MIISTIGIIKIQDKKKLCNMFESLKNSLE